MKIIFLDFDGVLNTPKTWGFRRERAVDADKVALLHHIVEATGAKIVVSSTWRRSYTLDELRSFLIAKGLPDADAIVIDTTDTNQDSNYDTRGECIDAWLHQHKDVTHFVVLDDLPEDEFEPVIQGYVGCYGVEGLTGREADKAIEILQNQASAFGA